MGVWDSGNFDNDTAADHLYDIVEGLIKDIRDAVVNPLELEADEYWGSAMPCNIELLTLIGSQHYSGFHYPDSEEAIKWKEVFMSAWLGSIDGLEPEESYKEERIKILNETFDKFIALSKECEK